jgi:hypothetical protein
MLPVPRIKNRVAAMPDRALTGGTDRHGRVNFRERRRFRRDDPDGLTQARPSKSPTAAPTTP